MSEQNETLNGEELLNPNQPDRKKVAAFIGFCLVLIALVGGLVWFKLFSPKEEAPSIPNTNISTTTTTASTSSKSRFQAGRTFEFEDEVAIEPPPPQPTVVEKPKEAPPPPPKKENHEVKARKTVLLDKSSASSSKGGIGQGGSEGGLGIVPLTTSPNTQTTDSFNLFAGEQDSSGLASKLTATKTNKALAGVLYNRDYLLAKGAYIDCVLNTNLNSTVAGMTKCTLTRNIYSDNGTTLLLERGSEVTGEYRANIAQGQNRLFVLWDRIKTPHGIVIDLASPATDSLGAGGVDGYVETHFWQRFGGAMMLSLVDDFAAYVATRGSENAINLENSSDTAQNMAAEALKHTINIPPTFYKNQGERVGIVVARDLDFSTVYQLKVHK
ncbi:TrbI/VirB10 family protein [Vibrio parahaemolyticus]|nr:TrbI/VirB10 family protein [Vibrio parahaemolyticus]EHR5466186.1 type IV secretion system protein VirB10 [Vibrio parahaemolyticus]ELZ7234004.1 type IV secretion system protein VirB10 [Vibrio parahaemolyticus]EMC9392167.1 type IV secretion system protein VirB10 [Vibrio parahaemolyticus]HDM8224986.1 type IV secretion system protein VirB10 [Vibrio campbellii]